MKLWVEYRDIHVFSYINICRVSRKLFGLEANIDAVKQTCMLLILAYLLIRLLNCLENAVELLKLLYLYDESFCRKWRQLAKSNVKTSFPLTMSTQQKLRQNGHFRPQRSQNVTQTNLSPFQGFLPKCHVQTAREFHHLNMEFVA